MKAKVKTWIRNVENGNIKGMTEKVLNEVKCSTETLQGFLPSAGMRKGITIHDLRSELNMSHQSLTACLSNLNDEGLINVVGQVEIDNAHYSIYSFVRDDFTRNLISMQREQEKLLQWLKRGKRFNHLLKEETRVEITKELNFRTWKERQN